MMIASRDFGGVVDCSNLHDAGFAAAKLAIGTVAPTLDGAVTEPSARMVFASHKLYRTIDPWNRFGNRRLIFSARTA
jgi:hypothetical protein